MIAKISTGSFTQGMVKYNHNKTISLKSGEPEAELLAIKNLPNKKFNTIVQTIEAYNGKNTRVKKPNIHISLNFHKDDILSNEKIIEIGDDYMKQMGFENQPYAIYRHFDREHPHIHIVSSVISAEGKKINDSHIYLRSQTLTRKLEEKYNIVKAIEKNGFLQEKDIHAAINEHLEQGKHSLTGILKRVLLDVLNLKPTTENEFEKLLENYQVKRILSYDKNNKVKGNYFDLYPIEYLNTKKGFKKSVGIDGYSLDINFGYDAIQLQLAINSKHKLELQNQMMGKIYSVLNPIINAKANNLSKIKLSELELDLKKKGIELLIKRTQTGENLQTIYGLLFKDCKTGFTYSASDIKLKTNDFLKLILDDKKYEIPNHARKVESETSELLDHPNFNILLVNNNISFTLELFSSLLTTASGNNDDSKPFKKKKIKKFKR